MGFDLEEKAKEAFVEDHFELAVKLLTQAILLDPTKPKLYNNCAQANNKLNNFTDLFFCLTFLYSILLCCFS
ncbi:unnamed protein product [Lathyrus sativus]|nr:unnamed protein product [Lathyrus sativus]